MTKDLEIIPQPLADFNVGTGTLFTTDEIFFIAENETYDDYEWDFGNGTTGQGSTSSTIYEQGGVYTVTLTVTQGGCESSVEIDIEVYSKNELYVPNVFNPNANNPENRVAKVYGTNISEDDFFFKIVNRWGNVMYETDSFFEANSKGWDGKEYNIDEMQALSTFTFVLSGKFNDGEKFEETGTITILR